MTRIFIVSPTTGELRAAEEWKNEAGDKVAEAQYIVIIPDDGSSAFMIPKNHLGSFTWKEAMAAAEHFTFNAAEGEKPTLPSRKQWIDIRMARECGLDQVLEMIGASKLLSDLNDRWFWTRELYLPAGASAKDYVAWSASRSGAGGAWIANGGGFAVNNGLYVSNLALPLLLYPFREANN